MNKRALVNLAALVGVLVLILAIMVFPASRMAVASAQTANEGDLEQTVETPAEEILDSEPTDTGSPDLPQLVTYAAADELTSE